MLGEGRSCKLSRGDDLARGSLPREKGPQTHPSRYSTSSGLCSGEGGPWTGVVKFHYERTNLSCKTEAEFDRKKPSPEIGQNSIEDHSRSLTVVSSQ